MDLEITQDLTDKRNSNRVTETVTDEADLLDEILGEVRRVRESQERTEKMVTQFIEAMSNNPMMRMMAGKMMGQ